MASHRSPEAPCFSAPNYVALCTNGIHNQGGEYPF
jgi:hypothetical protein